MPRGEIGGGKNISPDNGYTGDPATIENLDELGVGRRNLFREARNAAVLAGLGVIAGATGESAIQQIDTPNINEIQTTAENTGIIEGEKAILAPKLTKRILTGFNVYQTLQYANVVMESSVPFTIIYVMQGNSDGHQTAADALISSICDINLNKDLKSRADVIASLYQLLQGLFPGDDDIALFMAFACSDPDLQDGVGTTYKSADDAFIAKSLAALDNLLPRMFENYPNQVQEYIKALQCAGTIMRLNLQINTNEASTPDLISLNELWQTVTQTLNTAMVERLESPEDIYNLPWENMLDANASDFSYTVPGNDFPYWGLANNVDMEGAAADSIKHTLTLQGIDDHSTEVVLSTSDGRTAVILSPEANWRCDVTMDISEGFYIGQIAGLIVQADENIGGNMLALSRGSNNLVTASLLYSDNFVGGVYENEFVLVAEAGVPGLDLNHIRCTLINYSGRLYAYINGVAMLLSVAQSGIKGSNQTGKMGIFNGDGVISNMPVTFSNPSYSVLPAQHTNG